MHVANPDLLTATSVETADETQKAKSETPRATLILRLVLGIVALVALWGTSFVLFGIPGLYIPAVLAVPVIFVLLVIVSRG